MKFIINKLIKGSLRLIKYSRYWQLQSAIQMPQLHIEYRKRQFMLKPINLSFFVSIRIWFGISINIKDSFRLTLIRITVSVSFLFRFTPRTYSSLTSYMLYSIIFLKRNAIRFIDSLPSFDSTQTNQAESEKTWKRQQQSSHVKLCDKILWQLDKTQRC